MRANEPTASPPTPALQGAEGDQPAHAPSRAAPQFVAFNRLVQSTPALREYWHRMWLRHETALAATIAEATGAPEGDITATALAHFALESLGQFRGHDDPQHALREVFDLLENGWGQRIGGVTSGG
ncbi:hypothetical protein [Streptomyces sp. NPDC051173]|uniref:hypothetical protein n=1 Tax=Streptomyces sp. NPDC051173 TaxID=3155164 RepID=UPI003450B36F